MPEQETLERAEEAKREGKSPSTQAGEFVREEIHHVREGKHGARSPKQAIAIGLSKARKAGVKVPGAPRGTPSARKRKRVGTSSARRRRPSASRSRAVRGALKRESRHSTTRAALSRQARSAAKRRGAAARTRAGR